MILLGKEDRIAELMPTVKSSFQVLEGTKVRINEETTKPLLEVVEQFETYVKAWNPEQEIEYGLFRVGIPEFDSAAFREGLINAFCHRDYTMLGTMRLFIHMGNYHKNKTPSGVHVFPQRPDSSITEYYAQIASNSGKGLYSICLIYFFIKCATLWFFFPTIRVKGS